MRIEQEPVSEVTPHAGFAAGMTLEAYLKLGHGREHNERLRVFRALCVREVAASVPHAKAPASREDIALVLAAIYGANAGYTMNADAQRAARGAAEAIEAMGGTVYMGRNF
jgi:ribosomal protein L15